MRWESRRVGKPLYQDGERVWFVVAGGVDWRDHEVMEGEVMGERESGIYTIRRDRELWFVHQSRVHESQFAAEARARELTIKARSIPEQSTVERVLPRKSLWREAL